MVITVKDRLRRDPENPSRNATYTGTVVNLYVPKTLAGIANNIHGMTLIKPFPKQPLRNAKRLGGRRVYSLSSVYHSIHVVPVDEDSSDTNRDMYINNTADWDTYNMLWNESWEEDAAREAVRSKARRIRRTGSV